MTRILFVDDEPRVLDGLRQSLSTQRRVWDMSFAGNGALALETLQRAPFELIVSDMRMPGMDGAELLTRAAMIHPLAIRIVLSGQMDEAAASRAARVAHRFLAKPCDPDVLRATLTRALDLHATLTSEHIRGCLGGVSTLPSLPRACAALNQALESEEASVEAVAGIIESDVAMATKVLQLVNSSFFGISRKVSGVFQAVSYLGLNTMRNLVLAQAMFQAFGGSDVAALEREQSRALMCARVAKALLPDKRQAEAAATAGLLHHVGSLALATRLPAETREVHALAERAQIPLHEAERARLGTTHAEIGAYLLGLWGLPHDVIEGVAGHHAPWEAHRALDVCGAVHIADAVVNSLFLDPHEARLHGDSAPPELLSQFGVVAKLARIGAELRAS